MSPKKLVGKINKLCIWVLGKKQKFFKVVEKICLKSIIYHVETIGIVSNNKKRAKPERYF